MEETFPPYGEKGVKKLGYTVADDFRRAALLAGAAFLAGTLNGLLGTGGGMVLIFALSALLSPGHGKEIFVISSAGVFVFSLISVTIYGYGGSFPAADFPRFALAAAAGGVTGAFLFSRLPTRWLRRLFGLLLLYSGARLSGVIAWFLQMLS